MMRVRLWTVLDLQLNYTIFRVPTIKFSQLFFLNYGISLNHVCERLWVLGMLTDWRPV